MHVNRNKIIASIAPFLKVIFLGILWVNVALGQAVKLTEPNIENYVKSINKLKTDLKLIKVTYPSFSSCGGSNEGYYLNKKLVLIEAVLQSELGFTTRNYYLKSDQIVSINYREHFAEWQKYEQSLPEHHINYDSLHMTYIDTVYTVNMSNPNKVICVPAKKVASKKFDQALLVKLISCEKELQLELKEVVQQVAFLKQIKEMPFTCDAGVCGDPKYWEIVSLGKNAIELLIDHLDDTSSTEARHVLIGGNFLVAEIAFEAIKEIIHNIPTFDLLNLPKVEEGVCAKCVYWQHLNKSFANRQQFKAAVKQWYFANQKYLVWVNGNEFTTCECIGKHPNGGHFNKVVKE